MMIIKFPLDPSDPGHYQNTYGRFLADFTQRLIPIKEGVRNVVTTPCSHRSVCSVVGIVTLKEKVALYQEYSLSILLGFFPARATYWFVNTCCRLLPTIMAIFCFLPLVLYPFPVTFRAVRPEFVIFNLCFTTYTKTSVSTEKGCKNT